LPDREAAEKSWREANEWVETLKAEQQRIILATNGQHLLHAQGVFRDMAAVQKVSGSCSRLRSVLQRRSGSFI
jgi:hypothetical protein